MAPDTSLKQIIASAIERLGLREVARRLGTTEETTLRLAVGLDVRAGSLALAKVNAGLLQQEARAS